MSSEDPFGRRDDEPGGIPGGWLPPSSEPPAAPQEPERRPLWSRPAGEGGDRERPIFEQPGRGAEPAPSGGGGWEPAPTGTGPSQSSGKATASLVLGIVGLVVLPFVCSVLAIVLGRKARREIDASGGRLGGRGNATAGIVLGWIGLAFIVGLLLVIIGLGGDVEGGISGGDEPLISLVPGLA